MIITIVLYLKTPRTTETHENTDSVPRIHPNRGDHHPRHHSDALSNRNPELYQFKKKV